MTALYVLFALRGSPNSQKNANIAVNTLNSMITGILTLRLSNQKFSLSGKTASFLIAPIQNPFVSFKTL
jgi:hypothetical protein